MSSDQHQHGKYTIKTLVAGGCARARAFLGDTWLKDVPDAVGDSLGTALTTMRATLDAREAERAEQRRGTGSPTAEDYLETFLRLWPQVQDTAGWRMLLALASSPRPLTAGEIAAQGGYEGFQAANSMLGALAHQIVEDMGMDVEKRTDGTSRWTTALAEWHDRSGDVWQWRWKIRPEVAEALRRMRVLA
jgi:hypothetical protein